MGNLKAVVAASEMKTVRPERLQKLYAFMIVTIEACAFLSKYVTGTSKVYRVQEHLLPDSSIATTALF